MVLQTVRLRVNEVLDWMRPDAAPSLSRPLAPTPPIRLPRSRGASPSRATCWRRCRDEADARGARVALVLVPARLQLNDTDYGHLQASARAAGHELVRDAATTRFADALAPLGLPMLDLLPVLRAAAGPRRTVLPREHPLHAAGTRGRGAKRLRTFVGRDSRSSRCMRLSRLAPRRS